MPASKKKAASKKKSASKSGQLYVQCHQRVEGKTKTPFEAKLIREGHYHCQIEVDRKRHWVNRGACSSTPYTK